LKVKLLAAVLCTALAVAATAQARDEERTLDVDVLNFGIISTESTMNLRQGFEPFLADLEEGVGMPVRPFFATDYAGVIQAMRFGKVHVAWFGNKSAMEAVDRAEGEIFAQTVDVDGRPGYHSVVIVHKDSPYRSIEDIIEAGPELTFGNGDPNSTSGYLIPYYYIWARRDVDPARHFKAVRNSNHEGNFMAVANEHVDFATNNTETLGKLAETKPRLYKRVRVIWKSPLIPSDPLVWRKDLPGDLKNRIKAFILSYGRIGPESDRQREVLAGMSSGWAPFRHSSNAQLLRIREIQLVKDRMEVENSNMSAERKKEELDRIDKEIVRLQTFTELYELYF
jgi:phosphonate transport system substrate-binding protein